MYILSFPSFSLLRYDEAQSKDKKPEDKKPEVKGPVLTDLISSDEQDEAADSSSGGAVAGSV